MKNVFVVVLFCALAVATFAGQLRAEPKKPIKHISLAISTLQENAQMSRTQTVKAGTVCGTEIKSLESDEQIMSEEEKQDAAEEREERMGHKDALYGAVNNRVKGMMKMMKRLSGIRQKLTAHIDRVNKIFASKFKADDADMSSSQAVINQLKSHITEGNPQTEPIAENTLVSFLQQALGAKAAPECESATSAAFQMFNASHANHNKMMEYFKQEREKLGKVKMALDAMMNKKQSKILSLSRQSEELEKLMKHNKSSLNGAPVAVLGELVAKSIKQHDSVIRKSCGEIEAQTDAMVTERRAVYKELKQCKQQAGYLEDGISQDEELVRSKRPELNWDVLAKKFDADLEAKVRCSEVKDVLGDTAVISSSKCAEISQNGKVSRFQFFKTVAEILKQAGNTNSTAAASTASALAKPKASEQVFTLSEISV
jgi:hypothetical protein